MALRDKLDDQVAEAEQVFEDAMDRHVDELNRISDLISEMTEEEFERWLEGV